MARCSFHSSMYSISLLSLHPSVPLALFCFCHFLLPHSLISSNPSLLTHVPSIYFVLSVLCSHSILSTFSLSLHHPPPSLMPSRFTTLICLVSSLPVLQLLPTVSFLPIPLSLSLSLSPPHHPMHPSQFSALVALISSPPCGRYYDSFHPGFV